MTLRKKNELRHAKDATTNVPWHSGQNLLSNSLQEILKELVSLSSVCICHTLLRTRITNESNISHGKSYCQGVLKVSDL